MVAETAEEALEIIHHQRFDIIIIDYRLPGMDVLEFLKKSQRVQPNARKIMITAYGSGKICFQAKLNGIDELIEKPFTTKRLEQSLQDLILY